jgi:DNA-binding transcriptional ArsR family regulator
MKNEEKISQNIEILYSMREVIRRKIFEMIFMVGDEGISFKNIVIQGNIPPTTAAYHLKVLNDGSLIEKRFVNKDDRRDYSFYFVTDLGERAYFIIKELYRGLNEAEEDLDEGKLPNIQVVPLRYGPRCISVRRSEG